MRPDDHDPESCPVCKGRASTEFVEQVRAAAAQPTIVMTPAEVKAWLDQSDTSAMGAR